MVSGPRAAGRRRRQADCPADRARPPGAGDLRRDAGPVRRRGRAWYLDRGLRGVGGDKLIARRIELGRPVLGICVGMQVLFAAGVEHGIWTEGCGAWPGTVERLDADVLPHMGWNTVSPAAGSVLFAGISPGTRFYFVHSYALRSAGAGER